jgi:hypothetical protein
LSDFLVGQIEWDDFFSNVIIELNETEGSLADHLFFPIESLHLQNLASANRNLKGIRENHLGSIGDRLFRREVETSHYALDVHTYMEADG